MYRNLVEGWRKTTVNVCDVSQSLDRDFYSGPPEGEGTVLKRDRNVRFHGIMSVGATIRTFELVTRIFMEFYQNVMLLVVTQPAQMLIVLIAFDEVQETCKACLLTKILVISEVLMEVNMKNYILGYNIAMKLRAAFLSGCLVNRYQITRCHILEAVF